MCLHACLTKRELLERTDLFSPMFFSKALSTAPKREVMPNKCLGTKGWRDGGRKNALISNWIVSKEERDSKWYKVLQSLR